MPRRLPLINRLADFLVARKEYIASKISFPYETKEGFVFESIDKLPIACRNADYTTPCSASDLTRAGRVFLRDDLKMREQNVSGLSYIIQHSEYEATEKDPTTYLLRRNFATHLYTLGFPIEWSQYYMGHQIEDNSFKRSDFNDEAFLYQMAKLLERHPLNGTAYKPSKVTVSASDSTKKHIMIENAELNDPIEVSIICGGCDAMISIMESPHPLPGEIDITRFFDPIIDIDEKSIFDSNVLF